MSVFDEDQLRGFGVARCRSLAVSTGLLRRLYNTTVRVCDEHKPYFERRANALRSKYGLCSHISFQICQGLYNTTFRLTNFLAKIIFRLSIK